MPEPAYHVRCSGKQDFHSKLVEEKVFRLSEFFVFLFQGCICQKNMFIMLHCMSVAEFVVFLFYLAFAIVCMLSIYF